MLVSPGPIEREDAGHRYADQMKACRPAPQSRAAEHGFRAFEPEKLSDAILQACRRRQAGIGLPAVGPPVHRADSVCFRVWAIGWCGKWRESFGRTVDAIVGFMRQLPPGEPAHECGAEWPPGRACGPCRGDSRQAQSCNRSPGGVASTVSGVGR